MELEFIHRLSMRRNRSLDSSTAREERTGALPSVQERRSIDAGSCSKSVHRVPLRTTTDIHGCLHVAENTFVPGCIRSSRKGASPSHGGGQRFESASAYQRQKSSRR